MTLELLDRHPSPEGEVITFRIVECGHIHTRYANPDGDDATRADVKKFAADTAERIGLDPRDV